MPTPGAIDSSSHIKIHDEVDDQIVITDNTFDHEQQTRTQKRLIAHQRTFLKMTQCFGKFKNEMIQAGRVNQNQTEVTDDKDRKI